MTEVLVESYEEKTESKGFRTVLAHRDYARLWSGQLVSNIGTAISALALMFYAYGLTGSAMAMAILAPTVKIRSPMAHTARDIHNSRALGI